MKHLKITTFGMAEKIAKILRNSEQIQGENHSTLLRYLDSLISKQEQDIIKNSSVSDGRLAG